MKEFGKEIAKLKAGYERNITDLNEKITAKDEEIGRIKDVDNLQVEEFLEDIRKLELLNEEMRKLVGVPIPGEIIRLSESFNAKYPSAKILYAGYNIRLKSGNFRPEIVVQDFITPLWSHVAWLRERKLTLNDYMKKYPATPFGDILNMLAFDIFKAWAPTKRYQYDSDLYGIGEQWTPALDSWYVKQMDCENSSLELMALFGAAGITGPLLAFFWIVCGNCQLGGHATINAYDFKGSVWRHMETTRTNVPEATFYNLPTYDDLKDKLNITDVWFSFNPTMARHIFKTDAARESYDRRERFRNFVIQNGNQ